MDQTYESKYHDLEATHPWFLGRRHMIIRLLRGTDRNQKILEIGCSAGYLLEILKKYSFQNLFGIDISREAVELCRKKGIDQVFQMDAADPKFSNNEFDLIIASDILEHMPDDVAAMKKWYKILKPGGKLIVFTPAFNFLWTEHDEINHHFSRYTKKKLSEIFRVTGFATLRISYWNFILFFPTVVIRFFHRVLVKKRHKTHDHLYRMNSLARVLFLGLLQFENLLLEFINFPIGVSVFGVVKK